MIHNLAVANSTFLWFSMDFSFNKSLIAIEFIGDLLAPVGFHYLDQKTLGYSYPLLER